MVGTRRKPGRMGSYVEGYRAWLIETGYTSGTVRNMLQILGDLGRWMEQQEVEPAELGLETLEAFRQEWALARMPSMRSLAPLAEFLKSQGLFADRVMPETPADVLLADYRLWLIRQRGLSAATVLRYVNTAQRFLQDQPAGGNGVPEDALTGEHVVAFLLDEGSRVSVGAVKGRVAELRSLLRFAYLRGLTPRPLAEAVPPVAGWHQTGVPRSVTGREVRRMLKCCDTTAPVGIRDFAILMLVARLGLRSIEIARLELGDIDWRGGRITLRGKAGREDGMPLPVDVGEAIAAYLRRVRPVTAVRNVFIAVKAPLRGIRPDLVSDVTRRACDRAGLPRFGAHRLRHSLATEMLRGGASMVEISQVLRHRDLATTAVYAKVDFATLRTIARPWPGARSWPI